MKLLKIAKLTIYLNVLQNIEVNRIEEEYY